MSFEKDTNQKEMGAYYTKEDITEYICKNTILPFLLQQVATKLPAQSWDLLKTDPDRYIYEPVRRGAGRTNPRGSTPCHKTLRLVSIPKPRIFWGAAKIGTPPLPRPMPCPLRSGGKRSPATSAATI